MFTTSERRCKISISQQDKLLGIILFRKSIAVFGEKILRVFFS